MNIINKALEFALEAHAGQKDDSGKPYIVHPIQTADILKFVTNDENLIAAAYLHDVLEDCDIDYKTLVNEFNEDVANLVKEVTKKSYNTFPNLKTQRGIMLKFADRLSNISRMDNWPDDKKQFYLNNSIFWMYE